MERKELIRELLTELTNTTDKELKQIVQFRTSNKTPAPDKRLDKFREKAALKIRKPVPTPRKTVKDLVQQCKNKYKLVLAFIHWIIFDEKTYKDPAPKPWTS